MTRNSISVPPLEPRDPPAARNRRSAPEKAHVRHPDMDPSVADAARVGDVPDVISHDVMERDTPIQLYISIAIVTVIIILGVILLTVFL